MCKLAAVLVFETCYRSIVEICTEMETKTNLLCIWSP